MADNGNKKWSEAEKVSYVLISHPVARIFITLRRFIPWVSPIVSTNIKHCR